jgi:hypothetical protein
MRVAGSDIQQISVRILDIHPSPAEEPVQRASDGGGAAVQDMRVDHGRGDVLMAEQLLDRADVVAVFEKVRRERVAERMAAGVLRDAGGAQSASYRALHYRFVHVVSPSLTSEQVDVVSARRERPLPSDLTRCPRILPHESVG